jgi:beta-lactamase class A
MLARMRRSAALAVVGLVATLAPVGLSASSAGTAPPSAVGVSSSARGTNWSPRMKSAERYARRRAGRVSFAVVDMRGRMHVYNRGDTAPTASVIKVMFLAAYLRQGSVRGSPAPRGCTTFASTLPPGV